jgi:hypothetical protein
MSSKQRRRNQRKAQKAAAVMAKSASEPRGQTLEKNQNPEGDAPNGDQAKKDSENNGKKGSEPISPQAVNHHNAPQIAEDNQAESTGGHSVFSLTTKLSEDPDSIALQKAESEDIAPKAKKRSRLSLAAMGLIVTFVVGAPQALVAIWDALKYKGLQAQYHANNPLLTPEFSHAPGFQLYHRGRPVQDPYEILVTIRNTGTISIKPADISKPIQFAFSKKVLDASIIAKVPSDVDARCTYDDERVIVDLGMFHSKEEFTIRVYCDGKPELLNPTCRIDGIHHVEVINSIAPITPEPNRYSPINPS